jgi:hypothetical protein
MVRMVIVIYTVLSVVRVCPHVVSVDFSTEKTESKLDDVDMEDVGVFVSR